MSAALSSGRQHSTPPPSPSPPSRCDKGSTAQSTARGHTTFVVPHPPPRQVAIAMWNREITVATTLSREAPKHLPGYCRHQKSRICLPYLYDYAPSMTMLTWLVSANRLKNSRPAPWIEPGSLGENNCGVRNYNAPGKSQSRTSLTYGVYDVDDLTNPQAHCRSTVGRLPRNHYRVWCYNLLTSSSRLFPTVLLAKEQSNDGVVTAQPACAVYSIAPHGFGSARTGFDSRRGSSPIFRMWESRRACFLGITSPYIPALLSYSPCFTLIGSQDLDAKSRPNVFTLIHGRFSLRHEIYSNRNDNIRTASEKAEVNGNGLYPELEHRTLASRRHLSDTSHARLSWSRLIREVMAAERDYISARMPVYPRNLCFSQIFYSRGFSAYDRVRWYRGKPLDSHSGRPGSHLDLGSPWFPEITPNECWDVSLLQVDAQDSFNQPIPLRTRGRACAVATALALLEGEQGSIPEVGSLPDFRTRESCRMMLRFERLNSEVLRPDEGKEKRVWSST
ncbi:hypothetical protein PR048_027973 [Dryococelus australis]|uniref:Uncharacterized protein n=1 Tax=Dryococelus australis TaxID=614101 RepID=A0ABQ9GI15_9NEOP|nr:hypothetical protein PR048_027973 [Dryococelus australis]